MTQAILLMLHQDIEHAKKIIKYFQGKCDIFVHIDKGFDLNEYDKFSLESLPGVIGVYQKYHVHWGGFSILKTELFLLKKALIFSDFNYIHLISGQDYPIKPIHLFLNKFDNSSCEYFEYTHLPNPNWHSNTMYRLQNIFFMDFKPVKNDLDIVSKWNFAEKLAHYGLKRRIPDDFPHLYGGSQWFSLSRRCIINLLKYTHKRPKFYHKMRFVFAPDEIYIPTVVMNINYEKKKIINDNLRFVNWTEYNAPHPSFIKKEEFYKLAISNQFFARKIGGESAELISIIDKYLLQEEVPKYEKSGIRIQRTLLNYSFDEKLASCIKYLCKIMNVKKVIDLGCGPGYYVYYLRKNKILTYGYDGNPYVSEQSLLLMNRTKYPCEEVKIHKQLNVKDETDMLMFISVGEYIPQYYQNIVLDNICNITKKYLIVSWADNIKYDEHIVNPISNETLCKEIISRGFEIEPLPTQLLRDSCNNERNNKNIIFFKKNI